MLVSLKVAPSSARERAHNSHALALIEKLQSELKLSQDRVDAVQRQLALVTKNRDEMADEVVKLSNESEELNETIKQQKEAEIETKKLEKRFYCD